MALRARWLGRVAYEDAWVLQRAFFADRVSGDDWLLLLEHPHVYTVGARGDTSNMLVDPASVGAELVHTDRGGDITYHGPGQLVGYPIVTVPTGPGAISKYVHTVEQLVIDALDDVGLPGAGRLAGYRGVWVGLDDPRSLPRKIAAVGLRLSRGRSMHGFALNVDPDLGMFAPIVPCGITGKAVTSVVAEGVEVEMRAVVDAVVERAALRWGAPRGDASIVERQDVAWQLLDEGDEEVFLEGSGVAEVVTTCSDAHPPIAFTHDLETVARLQHTVRPGATYARSLAVLARARDAELVTRSGITLGLGESEAEVIGAFADLQGVGVHVATLGQHRSSGGSSRRDLPVLRWWTLEERSRLKAAGEAMGIPHVCR